MWMTTSLPYARPDTMVGTVARPSLICLRWSYCVGQSEGKVKVDSDWL